MKQYSVSIVASISENIDVSAENEAEAKIKAKELFDNLYMQDEFNVDMFIMEK